MSTVSTHGSQTTESHRPLAHVAMQNEAARMQIVELLERSGWAVVVELTGFHLLQAIADVIEGQHQRPDLIIVDAHSRGVAGTTVAAGLRELGFDLAIVLVAAPGEALPLSSDATLRIVDSESAAAVVAELVERTRQAQRPSAPRDWPAGTHAMPRVGEGDGEDRGP